MFLGLVCNGTAELTVLYPVSGGFVRHAGHFVDKAWGFMAGWNFFLYEGLLIPFEITALTTVLGYWSDNIPPWSIPIACVVLYGLINMLAVRAYGEAEFWLSGGKVILIFLLFFFTFVTMVGGNPQGDAYGFRHWQKPGAFAEYRTTGDLGRFEGFLGCLWSASFAIVGPEYMSMVAAEAKRPRVYIKSAFKTIYWRFLIFFVGSAFCVGTVVAYNDPTLYGIFVTGDLGGSGTASASPYVIAMKNLKINGLPHLVNALLVTSIFSAGNTYTYCASRSLYSMALEGRAPRVLQYCVKKGPMAGVPILCLAVTMIFPCLSFLQVSNGSLKVLNWLINLVTAGGVITFIVMCVNYIFFYRACKAQGLDRKTLPYCGWFQPYSAYLGLAWMIMIVTCYGYSSYAPWSTQDWFIYYAMLIVAFVTFFGWKIVHRTKFVNPYTVDLVWERPTIDAYEATFTDKPNGFWREMLQMVGIGRKKFGSDRRRSSVISQ